MSINISRQPIFDIFISFDNNERLNRILGKNKVNIYIYNYFTTNFADKNKMLTVLFTTTVLAKIQFFKYLKMKK